MARSKGLSTPYILLRHALRPSSFSLLAGAGLSIGSLFTGAFVVEILFQLPGIGFQLVHAIDSRDYLVVQGMALVAAIAYRGHQLRGRHPPHLPRPEGPPCLSSPRRWPWSPTPLAPIAGWRVRAPGSRPWRPDSGQRPPVQARRARASSSGSASAGWPS